MFIDRRILSSCGWQAFERLIARLLVHKGYSGVRVVGGSGDKGADIIALAPNRKRWLFQAKYWKKPVSETELHQTLDAGRAYKADFMVVVAPKGADGGGRLFQARVLSQGHNLSIWNEDDLIKQVESLSTLVKVRPPQGDYQAAAIDALADMICTGSPRSGLVVMATGLGKTFTAAEAIRRSRSSVRKQIVVVAHTNSLLLQLEKAFWSFLSPSETTVVWNHSEKPSAALLHEASYIFVTRDTLAHYVSSGGELPLLDLLLIDEAHHAHSKSVLYRQIVEGLRAGASNGPQLIGLTATPFLADPSATLSEFFGDNPLVKIDMVYGLKHGFLSQVDYRLFTDNIRWDGLRDLSGRSITPKEINRVFFIKEWDDAVINQLQSTWSELVSPKAVLFCSNVEHALLLRDKINARGFCAAGAIYSGTARGVAMSQYQRNLLLSDFERGDINVICTVDIFNEGIDVPDVNIVVFNRVTHSRRIFVQQLGRGLRVQPGKEKAIVLDFAQDIRRYAAGLKLKDELCPVPRRGATVSIGNKVVFRNASGEDPKAETFLRAWLHDVESIEAADDDAAGILKFPPELV